MRNVLSLSISVGCLIVSASVAHGQSPYTTPPQQPPQPYAAPAVPSYAPTPYRTVAPVPPTAYQQKSKVDHLGEAARHLEAAGLNDEAADIRQRVELARTKQRIAQQQKKHAAKKALLAKKLAELKALSAEVDRLRKAAEGPQQVLVDIKILKFSWAKWRALGIDFELVGDNGARDCIASGYDCECKADYQCDVPARNAVTTCVSDQGRAIHEFLKLAHKHDLVELIADPRVVTVSGRPATVFVGKQIPLPPKSQIAQPVAIRRVQAGTSIDVVPVVLDSGSIRLELRARLSDVDNNTSNGVPRVRIREIDTGAEVTPGQTLILRGLVSGKAAKKCDKPASCPSGECQGRSEFVVLATPTIVTSTPPTMVAPAPAKIAPHPYRSAIAPRSNAAKSGYSAGKKK